MFSKDFDLKLIRKRKREIRHDKIRNYVLSWIYWIRAKRKEYRIKKLKKIKEKKAKKEKKDNSTK
jgi:hypothetical protein